MYAEEFEMKSRILDAVHQTAAGLRKSGVITEDTESFITSVAGTLDDNFPDEISDDDLGVDVPRLEMD